MCQEVFEILKQMALSNVEVRLALQCAPVITGIKMSNLLIVSTENEEQVKEIFQGTGIHQYCLFRQEMKVVYFLYRIEELEAYLQASEVVQALKKFGYEDLSIIGIIQEFQKRYETYMNQRTTFPHEIGVLLGYPTEDVEGYIKNKGENYLYAGYWKVYKDAEDKKLLFDAYESAKEGLLLLVAHGYSMRSIIEYLQEKHIY